MHTTKNRFQSKHGFQISLPNTWSVYDHEHLVIIYLGENNHSNKFGNITIKKDVLDSETSLLDYTKLTMIQILEITKNEPVLSGLKDLIIDKKKAKLISYKMNYLGRDTKVCSCWLKHNNSFFSMAFTCLEKQFNDFIGDALEVFDSLKIISS